MAQQVQILLIARRDRSKAERVGASGLDGIGSEIDLTAGHYGRWVPRWRPAWLCATAGGQSVLDAGHR